MFSSDVHKEGSEKTIGKMPIKIEFSINKASVSLICD
jgi:hypothetical protein